MQMFYSPSANGFYAREIHGDKLPADSVAVDEATYKQFAGQQVMAGPDDQPMTPPAPPPSAPHSVTMRQARLALLAAEKLGMVELALAGLPSPQREAAAIEWEFAATVDRNSPLVTTMTSALGMTDDELDQLFMLASTL